MRARRGVQLLELGGGGAEAAQVGTAHLDARDRAARGRGKVQVGPERVRGVRRPGLPGGDHPGGLRPRPGQEEQDDLPDRIGAEGERGNHAEVAATPAAAGPEQVRVLAGTTRPDLAVGRDDLQRLHVVAGQAVGAGHHPDAAAQGEAGDADRRAGPARHPAAVRRQPVVEVDQPGPRADGGGAPADVHPGHPGHVDDQAAGRGPARVAVPATPGRDRDAELAHEGQAGRYVVRVAAIRDAGRMQRVESRVEQPLGHGVGGLTRTDQGAGQVVAEGGPVGRGR